MAVVEALLVLLLLGTHHAAALDGEQAQAVVVPRWPITCVTGVTSGWLPEDPPFLKHTNEYEYLAEGSLAQGCQHRSVKLPRPHVDATDVFPDVMHEWLNFQGSIKTGSDNVQPQTTHPFWCVYSTGEWSETVAREAVDQHEHKHSYVRNCPIPLSARRQLDMLLPVYARFVLPYSIVLEQLGDNSTAGARDVATEFPAAKGWYKICPHSHRCPPSRRLELRLPVNLPIFYLPNEPLPARFFADHVLPRKLRGNGRLSRGALAKMSPAELQQHAQPFLYEVMVCTMVKDTTDLIEWLEHHRIVGVEHMVVHDHMHDTRNSAIAKKLKPYVDQGFAGYVDWQFFNQNDDPLFDHDWVLQQVLANNHCYNKYKSLSKYVALFDRDEFIYPLGEHKNVTSLLRWVEANRLDPTKVALQGETWYFQRGSHPEQPPERPLTTISNIVRDNNAFVGMRQKTFMISSRTLYHSVHQLTLPNYREGNQVLDHDKELFFAHEKGAGNPQVEDSSIVHKYKDELLRRVLSSPGESI